MKVATPAMNLITGPWGKEILKGILGERRTPVDADPIVANYWLQSYSSKGLIVLQQTINAVGAPGSLRQNRNAGFPGVLL